MANKVMAAPLPRMLLRSSWRYIREHRWQSGLTLLGIVLGVAIVVAVDLANHSARHAFALSLDMVAGRSSHQIKGPASGIPEQLYVRLRRELGMRQSAPIVSDHVVISGQTYTLLGIDPVSELAMGRYLSPQKATSSGVLALGEYGGSALLLRPNTVVISRETANQLALDIDRTFTLRHRGRSHRVEVAGIFESDNQAATDGLLFADIAVAQEIFQRQGKLDRIDLELSEEQTRVVSQWLPAPLQLVVSETRNTTTRKMTEAFHINLTAMSLLALLVGGLLIYSTIAFSVLRRCSTLGAYRALGVTRRELFVLVIAEAGLLGLVGAALGVGLGLLLAQGLVQLVMRAVNDLYYVLSVTDFFITPVSLIKGLALGVGGTLLAALLPAREAAKTAPVSVQQRSVLEQRWRSYLPRIALAGVALLLAGRRLVSAPGDGTVGSGFVALALMVLGFSLMVPWLSRAVIRGLLWLFKSFSHSIGKMALRSLDAGLTRTGLAIAALTVAVSATVGVGVMVESFRHTVSLWLEQSLAGDVYVSVPGRASAHPGPGLPEPLLKRLPDLPGVAAMDTSRMVRVETEYGELRMLALEPGKRSGRDFPLKRPTGAQSKDQVRKAFEKGEGVLISEPLSHHRHLTVGDDLRIETDRGSADIPVLGVFSDYTSSQGLIVAHRDLYDRWWQDRETSGVTLYRDPSTTQRQLLQQVRQSVVEANAASQHGVQVRSSGEIREVSLRIFDRTFAITQVLRLLTIGVAFIGIFSALMSLQLERKRELAVLRATGATKGEVAAVVMVQTAVMGILAGLLAVPLGLMMSVVLIEVINLRSFGWSMQQIVPMGVMAEALWLALAAALLAGAYPAFNAAKSSPARALREE